MRRLSFFSLSVGLAFAIVPHVSSAQPASGGASGDAKGSVKVDDQPIDTKKPDQPASPDAANPNAPPKKQFGEGDSPLDDLDKDKDKDNKKPGAAEWFLGARFRDFIVPHFMFSLFASGGPENVNIFSGGPELTMRQGALEMDMSFTVPYADYSMNGFIFKNKNEPIDAYEVVGSSLKLFTFSLDLLGNIPVDKKGIFSILLGGGVGISGVSGSLWRNQVYPKNWQSINQAGDDPSQWEKCAGPNDPNGVAPAGAVGVAPKTNFCDDSNNHYGQNPNLKDSKGRPIPDGYSEKSWANGGSLPMVIPYLALPHIAFRLQPVKYLQMRIDTGFAFSGGFFVGFAAGGRLPI